MSRKSVVHEQVYKRDQAVFYAILTAGVCRAKVRFHFPGLLVPLKQKCIIHCATRLDY